MLLACERSGFYPLECVPLQFFVLSAGIAYVSAMLCRGSS